MVTIEDSVFRLNDCVWMLNLLKAHDTVFLPNSGPKVCLDDTDAAGATDTHGVIICCEDELHIICGACRKECAVDVGTLHAQDLAWTPHRHSEGEPEAVDMEWDLDLLQTLSLWKLEAATTRQRCLWATLGQGLLACTLRTLC